MFKKNEIEAIVKYGIHPTKGLFRYYDSERGIDKTMRFCFKANLVLAGILILSKIVALFSVSIISALLSLVLIAIPFLLFTAIDKILVELVVIMSWFVLWPVMNLIFNRMTR